jgi:hypothetical protein
LADIFELCAVEHDPFILKPVRSFALFWSEMERRETMFWDAEEIQIVLSCSSPQNFH